LSLSLDDTLGERGDATLSNFLNGADGRKVGKFSIHAK
jgi:hypothetical protein